jgi:VWFA-related protein
VPNRLLRPPVLRLGLLLAALGATSLPAQQPAAPPPPAAPSTPAQTSEIPTQRFKTEANYVRVDVYPTRDGAAVQDLAAEEFELLEDGQRQKIDAFEHVVISPAGPQSMRVEPGAVRAGEQMAANPRNRVFVFFLDIPHVAVDGSHRIKEPLIRLIDRILGPDDVIAVMTPEMSAAQITFGRKTEVIADMLRDRWTWGARHSIVPMDAREREYEQCYPPMTNEGSVAPVVLKMIHRRRERIVLDALHDLVTYLGGVREERKAILAITEGWVLYRPDATMTDLRKEPWTGEYEPVPGRPPIGVDEHGKLRVNPPSRKEGDQVADQTVCDRERMILASIDNDQHFRLLLDRANRYNSSFYPIDPRGLAAWDYPIGPAAPPPLQVDQAHLRTRISTLQTLAENTDGIAVVNSNNLDRGLQRIADDLTSYYLLGYYSSNPKLDGQFRRITVRVKRPGVQVRARRGYRAASAEEVAASRAAAAAPVPDNVRTAGAAIASLSRLRADQAFAIHAVPVRDQTGHQVTALWVAGEVQVSAREFAAGATATIDIGADGGAAAATLKPGERTFLLKVPISDAKAVIDVRARLTAAGVATPVSDAARIDLQGPGAPLMFRRGPSTGNRITPAADFRFSRTERLRLELPIAAGNMPGSGRFLDRNGQPLQLPVQVGEKTDADGQRWLTADAVLSALGAGDYVIEVTYTAGQTEQRRQTAVRITR